jgi:hypothetical protein
MRARCALIGLVVALAGCGAAAQPPLAPSAARELHRQLAVVRSAAGSGDRTRALAALDGFTRLVSREAAGGHLTEDEQRSLTTGAARVRATIARTVAAATPTPAPTPTPTPAVTAAPPPAKAHGPKEKHGHGHGHGGDD